MARNVLMVGSTWFHEAEVRLLVRALHPIRGSAVLDYPTRSVCNKLRRSLEGVLERPTEAQGGGEYVYRPFRGRLG